MGDNKFKHVLQNIPDILSSDDDLDKNFAKSILQFQKIVDFDCAYICYLNAGCANIQYRMFSCKELPVPPEENVINFPEILKTKLYDNEVFTFDEDSAFFNALKLQKTGSDFLIAKLNIRETVFGFMLIARTREYPFTKQDEELSKAMAALISYSIKDSELSNVFKLQLRALQDSIVEKTEAFATIKKQNEKILAADKVKNEFLANISHELRTPLNAIIGFSEALNMKIFGPLNEKQTEYVTDIHVSGLHLLGMINEILELSKIEAKAIKLALSRFNLQTSVNEVVNIVRPLANKKNIELQGPSDYLLYEVTQAVDSCYVYPTETPLTHAHEETTEVNTGTITLKLDISAEILIYTSEGFDTANPIQQKWTDQEVTIQTKTGNELKMGYKYVITLKFDIYGIQLQAVEMDWDDGGLHFIPITPTTDTGN